MSQSTARSNPIFPVGILITLHNIATITIAALGTAAEDILAKVQANLKFQNSFISLSFGVGRGNKSRDFKFT